MPGWKQRFGTDRSRSPPRGLSTTNTVKNWLLKWAWGGISAADVVRSAEAFKRDGNKDPAVDRILKGSRSIQNAERAVENLLPSDLVESVKLAASAVHEYVPPTNMLHWIQKKSASHLRLRLGAKQGGIASWWRQLLGTTAGPTFWAQHPYLIGRSPEDLKYYLPVVLHEDAVPISEHQSAYVRSWSSLLSIGKELETRLMICSYLKSANALEDKSWCPILQDFQCLAGPQAAGDWGAILLFVTGDMDWICNDIGLPHFNSNSCCFLCQANDTDLPHNDYHRDAAWRSTCKDEATFRADLRRPLHPLAASPIFSRFTYRLDLLHLLDHHGVVSHVVGNIFAMHVLSPSPILAGATQEDRIDFLNDDLKGFYRTHGVQNRIPALKLSNIMKDSFPQLHGKAIKAANSRALMPFALELQQRATAADHSDINRHALKVVESLNKAIDLMYGVGCFMTVGEHQRLEGLLHRMGVNYQLLAKRTCDAGEMKWKQVPKHHYCVGHLAEQASLVNPRFVQCYGFESLVGKIALIWQKCQDGPYHRIAQHKVMLKYRAGFALELS